MNTVLIATRVALAGIFLVAAITKLLDMRGFRSALEGFGVGSRWAAPAAVVLPIAEVVTACLLIPAATAQAGAGLAVVLLATFEVGIGLALRRGTRPQCHCFGQLHSQPAGREALGRNAVFMAIAFVVAFAGPGPQLGSWVTSSSGPVIALAATSLLVAVMAYVCLFLWQENRRLEGRAGQPSGPTPVPIGRVVPHFEARDLAGASIESDALLDEDRSTILVFTSATCGPCVQLLPELAQWRRMLSGRLNIHVLAAGDEDKNRQLSSEQEMPVLLDPESTVAAAFGVTATPTAVQIDPDGRVGAWPAVGTPEIEGLIRATLKPAQLTTRDQERFLEAMHNGGAHDLRLSVRDQQRLLHAIHKPVQDVDRAPASRWERSRSFSALRERVTKLLFERDMDTTGQTIELEHFNPDLVPYEPSSWLPLRWALRRIRPRPDDVFVDFGSGKGRVICQAARRPFARVVGVEISEKLVEAARVNVERNRRHFKCQDIELVSADATQWTIPDDMTIGYLYHPFAGATFRRVIDNVVRSIERNPRRVRLVYVGPVLETEILETGLFRLARRRRGRRGRSQLFNSVSVFEHDPSRAQVRPAPEVSATAG